MKKYLIMILSIGLTACGGSRIHYGGQTECDAAFAAAAAKVQSIVIGTTAESEVTTDMGGGGSPYTRADGSVARTYDLYGKPGDIGSYCGQYQFEFRNGVVTGQSQFKGYKE